MSDMLSQEEINKLLNNSYSSVQEDSDALQDVEKDTLGEVGNISMGSAATVLHNLLGRRVTITTPVVSVTDYKKLTERYDVPYVAIHVSYVEGLIGDNMLIIKTEDVKAITSLLLDDESYSVEGGELSEIHLSAISEVMNQMMGASATAMAKMVDKKINISPPRADIINFQNEYADMIEGNESEKLVSIAFRMEVENLFEPEIVLLMNLEFGKEIVEGFTKRIDVIEEENVIAKSNAMESIAQEAVSQIISNESVSTMQNTTRNTTPVSVRSVQFESFDVPANNATVENIDIMLDVPLQVTVELGRTKISLKEILELNVGSIVTLDKLSGELVDVVVNGKIIAKGEVVVADDNFAVRITDIMRSNKK